MSFKEIWRSSLRFLGNLILPILISGLCRSLKVKYLNYDKLRDLECSGERYIIAFWHGTMLLPWYLGRYKNLMAIISQSKDGSLLTNVLKQWKYNVVRGSSNKGGKIALEIMVDYLKHEGPVAITPDGPTGPRHKMKAGSVVAAKKTGVPIILVGVGYNKKWILRNWDKFEIPKFFSTANLVFSDPIYIKIDMNFDQTSAKILEVEKQFLSIQAEAGNF